MHRLLFTAHVTPAALTAFRRFLLIHAAAMALTHLKPNEGPFALTEPLAWVVAIGLCLSVPLAFWRPAAATRAALLLVAIECVGRFPRTANHAALTLICLLFLSYLDERKAEEAPLAGAALCLTTLIVFFWSGLQKLLLGTWDQGEFLAYSLARTPRFAPLSVLVPKEELFRLTSINPAAIGDGPYRFDAFLPLFLSNATYLAEMVLPLLLLFRRTRRAAAAALILLLFAIESMAREFFFGGLMLALLLLFFSRPLLERALLPMALLYAGYVAWVLA